MRYNFKFCFNKSSSVCLDITEFNSFEVANWALYRFRCAKRVQTHKKKLSKFRAYLCCFSNQFSPAFPLTSVPKLKVEGIAGDDLPVRVTFGASRCFDVEEMEEDVLEDDELDKYLELTSFDFGLLLGCPFSASDGNNGRLLGLRVVVAVDTAVTILPTFHNFHISHSLLQFPTPKP
nr:hypothetical protein Iba_chr15eCG3830 [Ipomoea batatas]